MFETMGPKSSSSSTRPDSSSGSLGGHRTARRSDLPGGRPLGAHDSTWALVHGLAFLHVDGQLDAVTPTVVADRVTASVQPLL